MQLNNSHSETSSNKHNGSYITFVCANTHYALNVDSVKYITSMDAIKVQNTPLDDGKINRVFYFADRPVSLYSFNKIVGSYSQVEESQKLKELLNARKQDHIDWMDALEHSIKTGETFAKATDPHLCAFGKWYDAYKSDDNELANIMAKFDKPHKHIHSLAENLLELSKDSDSQQQALDILEKEKHTTLHSLISLFNAAQARLDDMIKQVVIVLESNGKLFAIDLDNINQMEEFEETHWLADHIHFDSSIPCYDGYFQKENGDLYVNVNPNMLMH